MAKLLLVEDDNNLREIYEARLQAEGYTIVAAKDGEEALVQAKAEKPDLIISDVMMPKISGFEMLDILRNTEELKAVKIIMLTALGQSDDQQRADRLGADRYLVKSQVTLEDIVKVAHELLADEAGGAPGTPTATGSAAPAAPAPLVTPAATTASPAAATPPTSPPDVVTPAAPVTPPTPVVITPATPAATPVTTPPAGAAPAAVKTDTPAEPATAVPPATPAEPAKPVVIPVAVDPSAPGTAAFSTAQEEATIEAKIEDFVAGASSDPTKPGDASAVTDASAATSSDSDKTATAPTTPAVETPKQSDDVHSKTQPDTTTPKETPKEAPAEESSDIVGDSQSKTEASARKKVITPIDHSKDKSQNDIHTLAALEDIAEQAKQTSAPPIAAIVSDENGPPSTPIIQPASSTANEAADIAAAATAPVAGTVLTPPSGSTDKVDPNTIAL